MRALIYEQTGSIGAGALDVAGRPLLIRQLQWLRDRGIEDVVVEVALGSQAVERAELLLGTDPLTARCLVIPTRFAIGQQALAARAGLADDELYLALPADLMVHATLELPTVVTSYALAPPAFASQLAPITLALRTRLQEAEEVSELPDAWSLRIADLASAHSLSCAVLAGQVGDVLVHAAEVRPGIWLARGARVSEEATLLAPLLIGPDARVLARARVGPNVVVGRAAVLERDVVISETVVAPGTLVGEGMRVRQAQLDPRGLTSLPEHARTDLDEPLQLASTQGTGPLLIARLSALLLLVLLVLPWTLGFSIAALLGKRVVRGVGFRGRNLHVGTIGIALIDLVPALFDVLLGGRDLVGVASLKALEIEGSRADGPSRGGALDISTALAPQASTSTLLWMWRWYLKNKSGRLDRSLLLQARSRPAVALENRKSTASGS